MTRLPIRIAGLHQTYGKNTPVLADVNLELQAGESIALVGMNGAGKTTLIKSILDFIAVDTGKIEIYGITHTNYMARQHLAFLPEHFKPPYYLTGAEFINMMISLYGADSTMNEISYYARVLELGENVLNRPVRQYSKGMSQKLGLITCLASNRKLIIMDEPMSGLDPKSRLQLKQLLKEKSEQGVTLFFSTHLLADVGEICHKMAILHQGHIHFYGPPDECCHYYHTDNLESAYMQAIQHHDQHQPVWP